MTTIIFAALCVFSVFSMNWTEVENDVAAYLPDTYEAKQGLDIMDKEFKTYGSAKILIENTDEEKAAEISDEISNIDGVKSCEYSFNDSDSALFTVTLTDLEGEGKDTVEKLRDKFDSEDAFIYSEEGNSVSDQIGAEIRGLIVIIGVILVLVLTFTSSTYAEVPILLATFLAAALINKGTNFMLGKISFISDSVAIILQLAMSVDYAIIFCNRYKEAHKNLPVREAVIDSLASSVIVISSSSLTTIAGLFAMTFMEYGIGLDLGVALMHKNQNKVWTAEEKYELVAKVLAGESNRATAIAAGINNGLLYSWVRCYKMKGYQGLAAQRKGRPSKEPAMKKKMEPAELTPSEREEMIRLRAENERLRAENAVIKKEIALREERCAAQLKVKKLRSCKNSAKKDTN